MGESSLIWGEDPHVPFMSLFFCLNSCVVLVPMFYIPSIRWYKRDVVKIDILEKAFRLHINESILRVWRKFLIHTHYWSILCNDWYESLVWDFLMSHLSVTSWGCFSVVTKLILEHKVLGVSYIVSRTKSSIVLFIMGNSPHYE